MRVTIKQIAEIAGVARSTVDKVINDRPGVSDEVRDRVRYIANDLGYEANIIGKALAFQNKQLVIAVVMPNIDFTVAARVGIEKALQEVKAFGISIEYFLTKNYDTAQQISTLDYLITKKVAGIMIRPVDDIELRDAVRNVVSHGIPVVTFNSDLVDSGRLCFVGQDSLKAGRVAANLMAKIINNRGKVAIITGSMSLAALELRLEGFATLIQSNFPMIEIVEVVETHENKIITFQKTLDLLQRQNDLAGLYITGGPMAEVGKAIKMLGLTKSLKVVCFDLYPEVIELLNEGVVDFTIDQDPIAQGYIPIKVIFEYLFNNKKPEQEFISTTVEIREKESL
ncbi:MAG: LacI family DNA-binding transcriptional regulator [Eubacteriales bacterium]|nr:LacI family DNA-binding transcriptional regulator [Eubacteriales bacterium]